VDYLVAPKNCADIARRAEAVDWIFSTTAGERLKQFAGYHAKIAFMPNPVDPAMETGRAFANPNPTADVFYAIGGAPKGDTRPQVGQFLQENCPGVRFSLHGFARDNLFGKPYVEQMERCTMGINYSRMNQHYWYSSDRMAQYMGNGLLTFIDAATSFNEVIPQDAAVFYYSLEEMAEKIVFYKNNDAARRKAAEKGWQFAHYFFHTDKVARYILERVQEKPLSQDYGWPVDVY
jgi:hypothetical protein